MLRGPVHHGILSDEVLVGQFVEQSACVIEQAHLGVAGQPSLHTSRCLHLSPIEVLFKNLVRELV